MRLNSHALTVETMPSIAPTLFPCLSGLLLSLPGSPVASPAGSPMPLPPPDDVPEEVLRLEIITEVRSPIDGKPMSAADYAEFQSQQQDNPHPELSLPVDARQGVLLLQIRRALRSLWPF